MTDPTRTIGVAVGVTCGLLAIGIGVTAQIGRWITWQARRR